LRGLTATSEANVSSFDHLVGAGKQRQGDTGYIATRPVVVVPTNWPGNDASSLRPNLRVVACNVSGGMADLLPKHHNFAYSGRFLGRKNYRLGLPAVARQSKVADADPIVLVPTLADE